MTTRLIPPPNPSNQKPFSTQPGTKKKKGKKKKKDDRFPRTALGGFPFPKWGFFERYMKKKRKLKAQIKLLAGSKKTGNFASFGGKVICRREKELDQKEKKKKNKKTKLEAKMKEMQP